MNISVHRPSVRFFLYIIGEGHEGLLEPITVAFERRRGHTLDNGQFIAGLHK